MVLAEILSQNTDRAELQRLAVQPYADARFGQILPCLLSRGSEPPWHQRQSEFEGCSNCLHSLSSWDDLLDHRSHPYQIPAPLRGQNPSPCIRFWFQNLTTGSWPIRSCRSPKRPRSWTLPGPDSLPDAPCPRVQGY
jgi:hypothetical protein